VADEVAQRFAENLARCLKRAGYSQEKLAQLSELHRTQISELLRGRQLPRLDSVVRLSGALGVDPAELLKGIRFEPADQHGKYRISPAKKSD
jgi:transcriptional regulator with XRE-family HTH domain